MKPKSKALWKLAARTWRRLGILYAAGILLSAVCLTTALNALFAVQQEKSQPSQLRATAENIAETSVADIQKVESVLDAGAILEVPATLKIGEHQAELAIQGMKGEFIQGEYVHGQVFSESSSMPHIVLNQAAVKAFTDKDGRALGKDERPDWNAASYLDGERPLTAKVCGIVEDHQEEPKAYMSVSQAKNTLLHMGTIPKYSYVLVRIENMGREEKVLRELAKLGYMAEPTNPEQQEEWKRKDTEAAYLLLTGLLALLFAAAMGRKNMTIDELCHKDECMQLKYMGLQEKHIRSIGRKRSLLATMASMVVGSVIALAIPSFVEAEFREVSIFASPPCLWAYGIVAGGNLLLCLWTVKRREKP